MRFIHTGDIHLGYAPQSSEKWAQTRADEIWGTFERLIKQIKENPVDMLIIAGDLFDRQPLLREIKEVDYLFSTIKDTRVVLMAGNHDAIVPGSFYKDYVWSENVIFLGGRNIERVSIPELGVDVYGHSYFTEEIRECLYDNVLVEDPSVINILVGHGGDRKHIPINRRKFAGSDFDYIALGHIHNPDLDQRGKFAYCGSLEPTSPKDTGIRGYIAGEVTTESLDLEFVPFSKRNYKHLIVDIEPDTNLLELKFKVQDYVERHGHEHIYKFTIKGRRNPLMDIDFEDLAGICYLAEVVDKTVPDYDFELLYEENKDNILGMYVDNFLKKGDTITETQRKALQYGTRALLDSMEEK
ncbi:MAG: metallophosphoesterase [Lachnospiraceae bacterium]|nr:metallophosphoesterase [Lachnospiraceae bacterium]